MNVNATPDVLDRLRRYAEPFRSFPPPVFAHFPGGTDPVFPFAPDSDRGLGVLLLTAALHRPGGEAAAARILSGLYAQYGNDIFKLNRLPFEPLRDAIAALAPEGEPADRDRIPGILRSACDFFYRIGPLGPWLAAAPDWESRAAELCNEIHWMGLRSSLRTKARYFFWLACLAPGFGARHAQAASFTWPVGEGHMRFWIDIVKPPRAEVARAPEARLAAFFALAHAALPAEPWRLYPALDAFLRRDGSGGYVCRTVQGKCRSCPLSPLCPAAPHFISREG